MAIEWTQISSQPDRESGRPQWPRVEIDRDNFAHGVWTAVAATLAQPLRKRFDEHVNGHCAGDWWRCEKAQELWELLPDGDRIMFA